MVEKTVWIKVALSALVYLIIVTIIFSVIGYLVFSLFRLGEIGAILGAIFAIIASGAGFLEGISELRQEEEIATFTPQSPSSEPRTQRTSPTFASNRQVTPVAKVDISAASTSQVKLKKHVREFMCHACRGKEKITFECPVCKNYYCAACAFDLHAKCMDCNTALNRRTVI